MPSQGLLFPPLGVAYITSLLNKKGHQAIIRDGIGSSFRELVDYVGLVKPDIVGITMNTTIRFEALKLAKAVKDKYNLPIILGGPHPTLMPDQLLKNYPFVDYIIRNEGEYVCMNLLDALEKGRDWKYLKKIKGLSYKSDNKVFHNPPADVISDLDALPYPEYRFFDLKKYSKQPEHPKELTDYPMASIISSRGCPYRCTFCSSSTFWGHKIRYRKPEFVVDEIEKLYLRYGVRYIVFNDDNFTTDRKRAIEICKLLIKKRLHEKIAWLCRSEVNIVDRELLSWLKKANCDMIEYGVEDASEEGLRFFKKAHTLKQLFNAFKITNEVGLRSRSYFIVGGDHESLENIGLKKAVIERLNPTTTSASLLLAYPGTEIYEIGKKRGWWDDSIWLKPCIGKTFHNRAPIYPSKNFKLSQLFAASADIDYWWNSKKNSFNMKDKVRAAFILVKRGDFSKIFWMGKAVIKQSLNKL